MIIKIVIFILGLLSSLIFGSCEKIDSNRIPYSPVNIELDNAGLWQIYGVHSMGENRSFIKSLKVPANYNYTALTYTGYGGVVIIGGPNNEVLAYDLCCPVEARSDTRININSKYEGECPVCGSRYDLLYLGGGPISGPAVNKKYGLQRYRATANPLGGYVINR